MAHPDKLFFLEKHTELIVQRSRNVTDVVPASDESPQQAQLYADVTNRLKMVALRRLGSESGGLSHPKTFVVETLLDRPRHQGS